jgi:D-sedoheptulose 7-phosphate isomerase
MAITVCDNAALYLVELTAQLSRIDPVAIDGVAERVFRAWQNDRMVVTFGNGGSAFTASHFVTDLVKTAAIAGRRRLRAVSLTDNIGLVTAVGNDLNYEQTFVYPLESFARQSDLAIAISASGNSPNVVQACRWAKDHGVGVIALSGFSGGQISTIADLHVNIPSDNYGVIEDLHLSIGHMISQKLRSLILSDRTTL